MTAQKIWGVLLLGYCLVAAMVPMWLLLQPRGHLGGCFLYVALAGAAIGLVVSDRTLAGLFGGDAAIRYPAFTGWQAANGQSLVPMLFITIACGACSGFHSLIASGTTSKQLRRETDARDGSTRFVQERPRKRPAAGGPPPGATQAEQGRII